MRFNLVLAHQEESPWKADSPLGVCPLSVAVTVACPLFHSIWHCLSPWRYCQPGYWLDRSKNTQGKPQLGRGSNVSLFSVLYLVIW